MIPRIFHHIWLGEDPIPDAVEEMRDTWASHHPGWELRLWREEDLEWLRNLDLLKRATSYAQKADIARYEVVERYGGVYLDTDMECLRPITDLVCDLEFFAARVFGGAVATGIFGASAGHPLLHETVACLPVSCLFHRRVNFQTGPHLLTRVIEHGRWEDVVGVRIFPSPFFYPYDASEPWRSGETFPTAFAAHHWHHSWKGAEGVRVAWSDLKPTSFDETRNEVRSAIWSARERAHASASGRLVRPVKQLGRRFLTRAAAAVPRPIQAVPFGPDKLLVRGPLGTRLLCPVGDLSITPELATEGVYDPAFVKFLARALRRGMTFVDVGANLGLFTVVGAKLVGPGGRVISYECNPEMLDILQQNVALNWMDDRVAIVPKAAHRDGESRAFFAPAEMKGLGSTAVPLSGRTLRADAVTFDVDCERLDDGLKALPFIDLIKIDVEGGEADALEGMSALLSERRVGMISLEYRLDVIEDSQRLEMERQLTQLESDQEATFHVPGGEHPLKLDEVLATAHFSQLLVRFPFSSISLRAI